jgi:two-component system, OmpR family, copper resistance phosphate regulon response regulator CusR
MGRILVIEDEQKMSGLIQQSLIDQGHIVDAAFHPRKAQELVETTPYDLLLMDVMLPDLDGKELSRVIRARGFSGHILMLTALSTTHDKIQGLDAGADDYLTKPFELDELLARVRALLRRRSEQLTTLTHNGLVMDLIARTVTREGVAIDLTTREFALLELFLKNAGVVLDRNTIAQQVWGSSFDPESNVIDVYVNHLRKKMDRGFTQKMIKTIVGHGYILSKS